MLIHSIPKLNDKNDDIKIFQAALNAHCVPYPAIKEDGEFGPKTLGLCALIQKHKLGLSGTGIPGPTTLAYLGLTIIASTVSTTKKVAGSSRHLVPDMRLRLDEAIIPGGNPIASFAALDLPKMFEDVADTLFAMNIFETGGANMGQLVGEVQGTVENYKAGGDGDEWCAETAETVVAYIEDYLGVPSQVYTSANTQQIWLKSPANLRSQVFVPSTICCGNYPGTSKGHTMLAISQPDANHMNTIEGNASDACRKEVRGYPVPFKGLSILGFVSLYPGNIAPARVL